MSTLARKAVKTANHNDGVPSVRQAGDTADIVPSRRQIRISTEAFERIHDEAPGWDRYALESIYLGWAAEKEPARNEDARFIGWVRSFTKGKAAR